MAQQALLQAGDPVTMRVFYNRTMFEDETFRILNTIAEYSADKFPYASDEKKVEVIVKGQLSAPDYFKQEMEVTGEWRYDQKYGQYTIAVNYTIPVLPTTERGVYKFCKSVSGIGDTIAKRISRELKKGFTFPDGSRPDSDWFVSHIKGMRNSKAAALENKIRRMDVTAELTQLLKSCVSGQTIRSIASRYGSKALDVVTYTPYKMSLDRTVTFKSADEIAQAVGFTEKCAERICAGIINQVRQKKESTGAIIIEKEYVLNSTIQLLNLPEEDVAKVFTSMLNAKSLISAGPYCYCVEDYETEKNLASAVVNALNESKNIPDSDAKRYLESYTAWKKANPSITLAERQEDAVKAVAKNHLSVLTGGPGTGKTTVLKAVLETYKTAFPGSPVTLMAPTGLASKRMTDACGTNARTIHKTLGLVPSTNESGFDDSDGLSIDGGLVIVDEFSMVGIHLANFLFKAVLLKPNTRIVLVGDIDQLPPVSPGAVLDALISCGKVPVTKLNRNFRQEAGSAIVDAAYAINEGNTNLTFAGNFMMRDIDRPDNLTEETKAILENIKKAFAWSVKTFGADQTYVLTPKRKMKPKKDGQDCVETMLSAAYLNPILRDIANPPSEDKDFLKTGQKITRVGDRVINLKNTTEVLNGEVGIVESVENGEVPLVTVNFDGVKVEYPPDRMKELELAYAITVHKSQGMEYDSVIYPTSMTHGGMLQRNLLYTAVTRAKKNAVLIGSKSSLNKTIQTVKSKTKRDLLSARIQKYAD